MNRKPEIERMEAAMKRAAEKATHGTREERSGRFVVRGNAQSTARGDMRPIKPQRESDRKQ